MNNWRRGQAVRFSSRPSAVRRNSADFCVAGIMPAIRAVPDKTRISGWRSAVRSIRQSVTLGYTMSASTMNSQWASERRNPSAMMCRVMETGIRQAEG